MASRWPGVGVSMRRRRLQDQEQPEERTVLHPAPGPPEPSSRALGSLCRQFQRRLPLRAVSLNLGAGPAWKRLEPPEPEPQGLQATAHSAKSALGAMSQRIQESCQSGTKWLVETQGKARRRREAQKGSSPAARSLSLRARRAGADPAPPRRRSRRGAAFRSPHSPAEPLCFSESDGDLEPMGAGIQHLQKLSPWLEGAIVAEERGDMTEPLIGD